MKFTSYTAAAILAFALAQAGAVPSPQTSDAVSADPAAPPSDPVYYPEETEDGDIEKRGDNDKYHRKIDGVARPYGGHRFGGSDPGLHGPMPDEDSVDLTPYFDHSDPIVRHLARAAKRSPEFHWWERQGPKGLPSVTTGNPNVRNWMDPKEEAPWFKGLKRDAAQGAGGGMAGQGGHGNGQGQGEGHGGQGGGHGGPPGGMGGGKGEGQHGPPGGIGGGQGKGQGGAAGGMGGGQGAKWGGQGGQGGKGHGPMADEQ